MSCVAQQELQTVSMGQHFEITPCGLVVKGRPSFEAFDALGETLRTLQRIASGDCIPAWTCKQSGVYAFMDPKTLTAYIGSSRNIAKRYAVHRCLLQRGRHTNQHFQRAWTKHGEHGAFVLELTANDRVSLLKAEQKWIDLWGCLYNVAEIAGCPARKHLTEQQKQNIGNGNRGKVRTPEVKAAISASLRGKKQAPEIIAKRAASVKAHYREHPEKRMAQNERLRSEVVAEKRNAGIRKWAQSEAGRANGRKSSLARWKRHGKADRRRSCKVCSATFEYRQYGQETCSSKCAHQLAWARRRENATRRGSV